MRAKMLCCVLGAQHTDHNVLDRQTVPKQSTHRIGLIIWGGGVGGGGGRQRVTVSEDTEAQTTR